MLLNVFKTIIANIPLIAWQVDSFEAAIIIGFVLILYLLLMIYDRLTDVYFELKKK